MQAITNIVPMLSFWLDQVQPWPLSAALEHPLTSQHQCQASAPPHLAAPTKTSPCRGMACPHHATPLSGHLSPAPPCHPISPHSPESARHGPRRNRAPHSPENATPRRASDAHAHARARTANATGTPGRDVALTLHATPCLRSSSAPAPSHQQPPGQAHLAAGTL